MDQGTIYLHLGWPKAGTSFIQGILYDEANRDALASNGYLPLNGFYDKRSMKELEQVRTSTAESLGKQFKERIEGIDKDVSIIYSQESLAVLDLEEIKKLNEALRPYQVKVIFYLRRQDGYCESSWKQWLIKKYSFDEYFEEYLNNPVKYGMRLGYWAEVIGPENVIVKRYGKQYLQEGLAHDFFESLGVPLDQLAIKEEVSNRGFDRNVLELIYKSRAHLNNIHDHRLNKVFSSYANDTGPYTDYQLLSPEQRRKIFKLHEEENHSIAKRYLGSSDPLFDNSFNEEAYQEYKGLDVDFAVPYLSKIILDQFDTIRELKSKSSNRQSPAPPSLLKRIVSKLS